MQNICQQYDMPPLLGIMHTMYDRRDGACTAQKNWGGATFNDPIKTIHVPRVPKGSVNYETGVRIENDHDRDFYTHNQAGDPLVRELYDRGVAFPHMVSAGSSAAAAGSGAPYTAPAPVGEEQVVAPTDNSPVVRPMVRPGGAPAGVFIFPDQAKVVWTPRVPLLLS